jgi:hypothetical protein
MCSAAWTRSSRRGRGARAVLTAWQANPLRSYAHIWRVVDIGCVDDADGVLLVRRPDRRVHLVGAGGVGEGLRGLLRAGVDGWRLHELPAAQTPLQDAAPLLGPWVYAVLSRYGFGTLEELAAVPSLGLLDIRHFARKTQLVVDAALAAHRLLDDPAARAARERRRHHIDQQLSAAHRARLQAPCPVLCLAYSVMRAR